MSIMASTVWNDREPSYKPWTSWSALCGMTGSTPTGLELHGPFEKPTPTSKKEMTVLMHFHEFERNTHMDEDT